MASLTKLFQRQSKTASIAQTIADSVMMKSVKTTDQESEKGDDGEEMQRSSVDA